MPSDLPPVAAELYVRATLTPAKRQAAERRRPGLPGVGQIGGVLFLRGVAYLNRHSTLAMRPPDGVELSEDVTPEALDAWRHAAAEAAAAGASLAPRQPSAGECGPGRCSYGPGHSCRSVFPDNFPAGSVSKWVRR